MRKHSPSLRSLALLALLGTACSSSSPSPGGKPPGPRPITPGAAVTPKLSTEAQAELARLQQALAGTAGLTAEALLAKHAPAFAPALGYDPLAAKNLPLVQASMLKLTDAETAVLKTNGLVISDARRFPGFVYGYETIYSQDLPVFVSADSIMYAVHKSYDDILKAVEEASLMPDLRAMLREMRARLQVGAAASLGKQAQVDADLFLAVAGSLLEASDNLAPVAGASAAEIAGLVKAARDASGTKVVSLFGIDFEMDFSQFKPRGHYQDSPALGLYFRAMMWLGRTELPILYLDPSTQKLLFSRRALTGALALTALMDQAPTARWQRLDGAVRAFVGEPDSMDPSQVSALMKDLGVADAAAVVALPDDRIVQAVVAGGYGAQRIASQIVKTDPHEGTLPLSASFLLLGQRYVVDSHVFSNVVYDRTNVPGAPKRMMPDPLDVAFAALGNDQAAQLLAGELGKYKYAPDLEGMRLLVDAHGAGYWDANLYNRWLSALRALSPAPAELADPKTSGLPTVAATAAWGRRILNTQLASWAELRRDTILYVKQSYTGGIACEFPDAYVDPYPTFFARVGAYASAGVALADKLDFGADAMLGMRVKTYFLHLADVARILGDMAGRQRTGMPHSPEDLEFINKAVKIQRVCGADFAMGWYPELFFGNSTQFDPSIADVHTQPTDEGGGDVGRVLHVATGWPRLLVTTIDTCQGPRAYVGLVSSYHEKITEHYQRLDDKQWAAEIAKASAPDVAWMKDLVVR
jgi:hypothetical protein